MNLYEEYCLSRLIQERRPGWEEAINRLVIAALPVAKRYAQRKFPHLSDSEALSLCYLALVDAAKHFDLRVRKCRWARFFQWYVRGVLYRDVNSAREPLIPLSHLEHADAEGTLLERLEIEDFPFQQIHIREQWAMIRPYFEQLSHKERQVLECYSVGLSLVEISRKLELPYSRVLTLFNNAIATLRARLKDLDCR